MELFETLFQVWLAEGGLTKPALREDLERELREVKPVERKKLCPHGISPLLCNVCYFENYGSK